MTRKQRLALYVSLFAQFFICCGFFVCGVIYMSVNFEKFNTAIFVFMIVLFLLSTLFLVVAMWASSDYVTPNGTVFKPKFWAWCLAMHTPTSRFMRDPETQKLCWCKNAIFVRDTDKKTDDKYGRKSQI